ncbi:MAG: hypothetical protein AAF702_20600 [Chloroflexota bacterium]
MNHKYGFHVNRTGDDVFDAIRRIKPKVIKMLDYDIGFWTRVREIHPDVFLIARDFVPNHEQDKFVSDPAGAGARYAERILALEVNQQTHQGRRLIDGWETYNELLAGHSENELKKKYDDFQVAFAQKISAGGFEPVAMNFATGNMLGEDFLRFFPGTLETCRYLGFHEYDWPTMWRIHEENIKEKDEGGMWLSLRYRRIMNEVRQQMGNRHIVVMTECGMTQGVQGGPDVGPWHESHPISEQSYWDSLMWYNSELMQDDYVMGAALFVVGAVDPWHSFEHLGGIMERLDRFQNGNPPPVVSKPDLPEPSPIISPPPVIKPPEPNLEPNALSLQEELRIAGQQHQLIQFNPDAALQKRIFADDFVPNSGEFTIERDGIQYVAQRAEHLGSGEVRVYYVQIGDWGNVQFA